LSVTSCALNEQKSFHSSYKSWVTSIEGYNKSLESEKKSFSFKAPGEPRSGYFSKFKSFRESDSGFARKNFGSLSRENLETYADDIAISIGAYITFTQDSTDPFGNSKAGTLVE
jgi:hypothetical protein